MGEARELMQALQQQLEATAKHYSDADDTAGSVILAAATKTISNAIDRALAAQPDADAVPELPEWKDDTAAALLQRAMKPEEISGENQGARVDELVRWMVRFGDGHANPKWLAEHAAELAYYAYQQRLAARERARRGG